MTAKIVNLNQFKKIKGRELKERQAQVNRVKFGQSNADKRRQEYETQRQIKDLSGKRMEDDSPEKG